jgi:UDP-N-acetylglucosamine 1-carboxyvinyltransferase
MTRFRVHASGPLEGAVEVSGATKNSGLKHMAAALLAPGITTVHNMPAVRDLDVMIELLRATGAVVDQPEPDVVRIDASRELTPEAPYELVSRMRASFNVLGPLLARCGEARIALPGGDNIGSRKVDMHLRGLEAMGADTCARVPRCCAARASCSSFRASVQPKT